MVADRSQRRSVKKTCQWQVFSVGHACFTGMVRWFLLICEGEFSAELKRGETHARGFPSDIAGSLLYAQLPPQNRLVNPTATPSTWTLPFQNCSAATSSGGSPALAGWRMTHSPCW